MCAVAAPTEAVLAGAADGRARGVTTDLGTLSGTRTVAAKGWNLQHSALA